MEFESAQYFKKDLEAYSDYARVMSKTECLFCRNPATRGCPDLRNTYWYSCNEICGTYEILDTLIPQIETLYQHFGTDTQNPEINWRQLQLQCVATMIEFAEQYPGYRIIWVGNDPKPQEGDNIQQLKVWDAGKVSVNHQDKEDSLIRLFRNKSNEQSDPFSNVYVTLKDCWRLKIYPGTISRSSTEELAFWLQSLKRQNLISSLEIGGTNIALGRLASLKLTPEVWKKGNSTQRKSNKVFIATAFSWPEGDTDRISIIQSIKRACADLNYQASPVSQDHNENISVKILNEIKESRFVVAEFTYNNRGVYFESGYARGLGIPVFHIVKDGFNLKTTEADKDGKKLHFDIEQIMYRTYKSSDDLYEQLKAWIENTVGKFG